MWFRFGLIPFKNPWELFLEEWLDFHFKGAALHKINSLIILITYSFIIYFNILQYYCLLIPPRPFHSYKIKT